jgi:hypothetical protein
MVLALAFALALSVAGCDEDDDDYSYVSENCTGVDLGEDERYDLCCTLRCEGESDWDDYHEECRADYTCTASTGDTCPHEIIEFYGYPECIY